VPCPIGRSTRAASPPTRTRQNGSFWACSWSSFSGGFGLGLDTHIQLAYEFLCCNYTPGDEIYLFAFSRGVYTVRSLAGLINHSGLLKRVHARRF
jgi:uncharacterized protein (DUF2235 family)